MSLTKDNIPNELRLETIIKTLNIDKSLAIISSSCEGEIDQKIKLLNKPYFAELIQEFAEFRNISCVTNEDSTFEISLSNGFRGSYKTWKFYNIKLKYLHRLLNEFKQIEEI